MQGELKKSFLMSCLPILAASFLFSACGKTDYKAPDIKMPEMPDFRTLMLTCDKKESEQPALSSEILQRKIIVEDQIESKDLEYIGCDGKVLKTTHGPDHDLFKVVTIEAPENLPEKVQYVSVENFATCAVHKFDAKDANVKGDQIILPDGKTFTIPTISSTAERSGKMAIQISDTTMKLGFNLNVHDGGNVLKIRYFGKCAKLRTQADKIGKASDDSYLNCEQDNEIGSKDIFLEVKVNRPEVAGKKQIIDCEKK